MAVARTPTEDDADSEPTARVVGTTASHLEDRINRAERHLHDQIREMDKRIDERFMAQEKAVHAALAATKEAITKAEAAAERRFDAVNEFRDQLRDQAATFMPRAESLALHARAQEDIAELKERAWAAQGEDTGTATQRNRQVMVIGLMLTVATIVIAIIVAVADAITGGP